MPKGFNSFTPPTGPNAGMSRDGHASLRLALDEKWVALGIAIVVAIVLRAVWK